VRKYDRDGDELPDLWEETIINASIADLDPNNNISSIEGVLPGDDFDQDGMSNWDEFLAGSDPTDYYHRGNVTIIPQIRILSGNNQVALPSSSLPKRLTVVITDSATGDALDNAPVEFLANSGKLSRGFARSLADGRTAVSFKTPEIPGLSLIDVSTGSVSVQFSVTTLPPDSDGKVPNAPTNFIAVDNPDGSKSLSWTDNSDNEDEFVVWEKDGNGVWVEIGSVPTDQTSVTLNSDGSLSP